MTNTKGGKVRVIELPTVLYQKVSEIVQREGVFGFDYRSYLSDLKAAALETEQPYQASHGLRWNYSQNAVRTIQEQGLGYDEALQQVSTSLGHVRPEITEHYTR